MGDFIQNLEISLRKGFIDQHYGKSARHKPQLLVNNHHKNENVLTTLSHELQHCESFIFSVAFITESGLATLKSIFWDLKKKGVKGRILTSTYLYFNKPKIFKELLKIDNIEVRLTDIQGFHSKGYIFKHKDYYSLIVGSSNLTAHALKVNYEWNIKISSHENGEIVYHFNNQFEEVWQCSQPLTELWIKKYEQTYIKSTEEQAVEQVIEFPGQYEINSIENALKIQPNKMQQTALKEIESLRKSGVDKGLVISATGTGKTYLAAFDVRRFAPKRMLFIVHREQILNKAKEDFKKVLGGYDHEFGILSGTNKQTDAKYLFATIQTISKDENLTYFDKEAFDYILIDEVHKAGAHSYLKVIDYFKPKFLMGMTATPERTDDFNIYELFNYNIAYEIRLQEALEEDMLCPFHYYGVTDIEYYGELIDDSTILSKLVTEERVNHMIEKINYYGFSGESVKGLIFCSRKEEAEKLSSALNEKGFRTVALTGDHSQEERALRVTELEEGLLDYILTVDIFNEGIDIPSINQVIMLRQTQSSIVFIQQLGRGLRKHHSKEFVTIIDFIGNYKNNYLIPIALSGDQSLNKDNIRRHMKDTTYIKGVSTINFEEIAKKQIFQAINKSNLTTLKMLRDAYIALKNRIGTVPYLTDFIINNSIDPVVVVGKTNYYQFLKKMKEDTPHLSDYENKILTMLSQEVLNGKRKHEMILLQLLLNNKSVSYDDYIKTLDEENCYYDETTLKSVQRVFNLSFFTKSDQKKYGEQPIIYLTNNDLFQFNELIEKSLTNNDAFKKFIVDIVHCAFMKSEKYHCNNPLTLYEKYSRKDVCRLLNWDSDEKGTMFGYKTKHQTCPIFITYHKHEEVDSSINYGDEFLSPDTLKWFTRSNRKLSSEEVQTIVHAEENNIDIHIFVKKDDDEGTDFYYLGKSLPDKNSVSETTMTGKEGNEIPVVHMNMIMENTIENNLYSYIIDEN